MKTGRIHYSVWMQHNLSVQNYRVNWGEVRRDSVLLITASEFAREEAPKGTSPRFVGDARVRVACVAPHDGWLEFRLVVDWPGDDEPIIDWGLPAHVPLPVVVDITLLDSEVVDVLHERV